MWVKYQSEPVKSVCNPNEDVDDLLRKIKQDLSPRFDAVPIDSLFLNDGKTNENLPRYKTVSEIVKNNSYSEPLVVSIMKNDFDFRNVDDLIVLRNYVADFHRKNDYEHAKSAVEKIIEVLKQKKEIFIIDGQWESSSLITKLGENAKNYLAPMHPIPVDVKDDRTVLEKQCLGQYTPLAPFFKNIPLEKLTYEIENQLIDNLPKDYRPLGQRFFWFHLKDFMEKKIEGRQWY